jgi:hypothetical protein
MKRNREGREREREKAIEGLRKTESRSVLNSDASGPDFSRKAKNWSVKAMIIAQ